MQYDIKSVALYYIQKYNPTEEVREKAIQQTMNFCTRIFPAMDTDEISREVRDIWEFHRWQHNRKIVEVNETITSGWAFGYTPILTQGESPQASKTPTQALEEEENRLIAKWGTEGLRNKFLNIPNELKELEELVLELRLGLTNGYIYTHREIGMIVGLTVPRISRIESEAFSKVRRHLE